MIQLVGKNKKVLDVGCATGQIDKRLTQNDCEVVGIEKDRQAAKLARKYCKKVIVGDIEILTKLPFPKKYFDIIIFGDILEHLRQPLDVIIKLKKYLKNAGYIVCSIPNVANWVIRLKLLFGRWEYKEMGLLDKTHLRFFTFKTAKSLIEKAGFVIEKIDMTTNLSRFFGKAGKIITKTNPPLFGYQFIIKASKYKI